MVCLLWTQSSIDAMAQVVKALQASGAIPTGRVELFIRMASRTAAPSIEGATH